ncbi:MAG: LAGLIDADG family homing endonuclease [Candidatus Omnitrophica bacterium]|nr:LAGLIDADG family homing endonuclease [Candidatus Omnitrophota bacterium]
MDKITVAYLQGTLGDSTYSKLHKTYRISQNNREWLLMLKNLLQSLEIKGWIYKEGKSRDVYVLETTFQSLSGDFDPCSLETTEEKQAYIRGYFDAEGGTSRVNTVRFYLQFAEKNKTRIEKVRNLLKELGINCGKIHNPSKVTDPDYWRFYVSADSYDKFVKEIGSWHPRKQKLLSKRVKI